MIHGSKQGSASVSSKLAGVAGKKHNLL